MSAAYSLLKTYMISVSFCKIYALYTKDGFGHTPIRGVFAPSLHRLGGG